MSVLSVIKLPAETIAAKRAFCSAVAFLLIVCKTFNCIALQSLRHLAAFPLYMKSPLKFFPSAKNTSAACKSFRMLAITSACLSYLGLVIPSSAFPASEYGISPISIVIPNPYDAFINNSIPLNEDSDGLPLANSTIRLRLVNF